LKVKMQNLILLRDKAIKSYIKKYVQTRINNNQNFLGVICGSTGSGKSYSSLRFGEMADETFNIDRVALKPEDFTNILHKMISDPHTKKGSVVVCDEAGTTLPAREWWSLANTQINYILQTFRYKNVIVFFNVPNLDYIDKQARGLFHAFFETVGIDRKSKEVVLKPLMFQTNPKSGKIYTRYPILVKESKTYQIGRMRLGLPSEELRKEYEIKKAQFGRWIAEGAKIKVKIAEDKRTWYDHTCIKCKYNWRTQTEYPESCPRCRTRKWLERKNTHQVQESVKVDLKI